MTVSQDRAAQKHAVHAKLMSLEENELASAKAHYENYLRDSQLDDREAHDKDDIADARESADLAAAFDHPIHAHQAKIDAIENTDFSVTETVQPGAVISFSGRHFVVVVSTVKFDCNGVTYMGISTQSPIYKAMEGLKKGERFTFNGREIVLDDVI